MATRGGQPGNNNATKNKIWISALNRYVAQNPEKLAKAAEALVMKAAEGDVSAIKELGDRLDGKAAQTLEHTGSVGLFNILANLAGQYAEDSTSEGDQCH